MNLPNNTQANATANLNTRMSQMCGVIKQNGIEIYTALFNHDGSISAATQTLFQNCATAPDHYFLTPHPGAVAERLHRDRLPARQSSPRPVRRHRASCLLALLASLVLAAPSARAAARCLEEAASAERRHGLPAGLLRAIGVVESGRWSNEERAVLPSPFAVNAAGQSRFFNTAAEAAAFVAERQRQGVRLIDVGCFQIDLFYHPTVFRRIEDAFDPVANAEYAAAFLARLHTATHDWSRAVASYHSAHAGQGHPYAAAVLGAWGRPAEGRPTAPALPAVTTVSWQPSEWVAGVHVQRPGMAGSVMPRRAGPRLPAVFTPTS